MTVGETPPPEVVRGVVALRRLLGERTFDLREVGDDARFRDWLRPHSDRWERDPVFAACRRIADLRRTVPGLLAAEADHRRAAAADAGSAAFPRLRGLDREAEGVEKAIAGLTASIAAATADRAAELRRKREAFLSRRQAIAAERTALATGSGERTALLRIEDRRRRLHESSGLAEAEADLRRLSLDRGRRGGRGGRTFEATAAAIARRHVVPEVAGPVEGRHGVRVLRGVTLGAATVELDLVVVRTPRRAGDPVDVLAVIEAKRNVNDLAHGFLRRQTDLAWLTGDPTGYDPAACRTRAFRSGHFDRPAEYQLADETFVFSRRSFRRFGRDPGTGLYMNRLHFITRIGPVWGIGSAALRRLGRRIATEGLPSDDAALVGLRAWCRTLARPVETPDVLGLYAADPERAGSVLLVTDRADAASRR